MRIRALVIFLSLLLSALRLHAFGCCENFGNIGVDVEWIYFRPSIDTNMVTKTTSVGLLSTSDTVAVVPPYHSGWRVGASYQFCDCQDSLSLRWTQLRTSNTRHFTGTNFNSIAGGVGATTGVFVRDKLEFDYYALEGVLTHRIFSDCTFLMDFIAGAQYAWIGVDEKVSLTSAILSQFAKQSGHFWGVGPEFGIDFSFCICGGFSIEGRGTGSLLVSRVHESVQGVNPGSINNVKGHPFWRVVPTWDFRAGLRYERLFCCLDFYVEAGYEVLSYVRGLRLESFTQSASSSLEFSNADMHGPYVALGITY